MASPVVLFSEGVRALGGIFIRDEVRECVDFPTNEKLPEHLKHDIRNLLQDAQEKLELLQQEISNFNASVVPALLLDRRVLCIELIERLRIAIAPHKRLVPEILAHIFHFTLPDKFSVIIGPGLSRLRTRDQTRTVLPWRLGHICSHWRQVALSDSRLWNRVRINFPSPRHIAMFEAVLARNYHAPLQVDATLLLDSIPTFILPYAARFTQLGLKGTTQVLDAFVSLPQGLFTSLQEVSFGPVRGGAPVTIQDAGMRVFQDSNLLRKVDMFVGLPSNSSADILRLPFRQLTHIRLETVSPGVALEILEKAEVLERCAFWIGADSGFDLVLPKERRLPCLRSLSLRLETYITGTAFLRHLTLPSLIELKWICDPSVPLSLQELRSFSPPDLIAFIDRSSCPLQHLESNYAQDMGIIFERLQHLLVSLTMWESILPRSIVRRISRGGYAVDLRCLCCRIDYGDSGEFVNMIEARWSAQIMEAKEWRTEFGIKVGCTPENDYPMLRRRVSALEDRLGIKGNLALIPDQVDNFL